MVKIDRNTISGLLEVRDRLESLLDHVIIYRQASIYKREMRRISVRIERALTNINEALDECKQGKM